MYMETSISGEADESRNLSTAWAQVAAVVTAVDATLGKWLVDNYGIGLTEYRAALHISRSADRELRITELSRRVGLNQSSATRLVGRMEQKELAFRDTCPDDGRGVFAVITDKGLKTVDEVREPFESKIRELLQDAATHYPHLNLAGLEDSFAAINTLLS